MWEDREKQELKEAAQGIYDTWQITILQEPRKDEGRTFLID